ncbi:MAG: VCBS repeat-containing protein [Cyclobacteriaceae bacterium]|nr:VCBS repeat-containing protein [Cyclobacteriaceae bacterium HetDA_MAG_MS6]
MSASLKSYKSISLSLLLSITSVYHAIGQGFEDKHVAAGLGVISRNISIAIADYDGDGDYDLFCVAHPSFDPLDPTTWNRLMQNDGLGHFVDVTLEAGFSDQFVNTGIAATLGEKMGASWGDYDNDGLPDLFLANSREDQLYHNNGDGTFTDITDQAGVAGCNDCYSPGGTWMDYDNDGDLDLYVSNLRGPNRMYQNNGDNTFSDVTDRARCGGEGITWAAIPIDLGRDGWLDIYTANDTQINELFENRTSTFNEVSRAYRVANEGAGMGVTIGDYNNDGNFDLYVTNIFNHLPNPLLENQGNRRFEDVAYAMRVDNAGWGWGTRFFDYDNDGDEDLYVVTGVVSKQVINNQEQVDTDNFFFKNLLVEGGVGFADFSEESDTNGKARGRSLEDFDFDLDGDLDLIIANVEEPPYLYINETIVDQTPEDKNWLKVKLVGTISNKDAIGTELIFTVGSQKYYRWYTGGGIFTQSLKPIHVGIGAATKVDQIEIVWPLGLREIVTDLKANQQIEIIEGNNEIEVISSIAPSTSLKATVYPNPFIGNVQFRIAPEIDEDVLISIYSIDGRQLLIQEVVQTADNPWTWDGSDLNAGLYLYDLRTSRNTLKGLIQKK